MSKASKSHDKKIKESIQSSLSHSQPLQKVWPPEDKQVNLQQELAKKEALKNRALEQDIQLKKLTLMILFLFLSLETIAVFTFAYLQGSGAIKIEEWSFRLLLGATILQITIMLQVAVKSLFPLKNEEKTTK